MATAAAMCRPHASEARRPRIWKPGRRRQGCGRLADASPVRDERTANLEQRGPRSGDARKYFAYYLFVWWPLSIIEPLFRRKLKIPIIDSCPGGD